MDIWQIIIVLLLLVGAAGFYVFRKYYLTLLYKEVDRARRSEHIKTVFLANVSNALRNPLNNIISKSNDMLTTGVENTKAEQLTDSLTQINKDGNQLMYFISQLLELSSFESGVQTFTLIEVNLAELMASYRREAMNLTKPNVSLRVRTDLSPHCKVTLDTNFMHQLMMHLLNNAAKHATQGEIIVTYTSERKGLKVMINYQGNGQVDVISDDIFSYLQKDALKMTGDVNGLGLPICKAIIDAVGGELDIDTQDGRKTVAQFWFPCKMRDKHKRN